MYHHVRTDLAVEARKLCQDIQGVESLPGVHAEEQSRYGFSITTVDILDERGVEAIGKPCGTYITIDLEGLIHREQNSFANAASLISEFIHNLINFDTNDSFLIAGLGNRGITPDAIGPETVDHILVTRHLKERLPDDFADFRPVSAICSGVLGTTGIESGDLIRSVVEMLRPSTVIAVDALASLGTERLCRTVQIADTGIVPGSGVGNARKALNQNTLNVPVIAIGVPTVVDAATLTMDLAQRSGITLDPSGFGDVGSMIVTPRDIDKYVRDISKLIGYSINLALHENLSISDIDMLLS